MVKKRSGSTLKQIDSQKVYQKKKVPTYQVLEPTDNNFLNYEEIYHDKNKNIYAKELEKLEDSYVPREFKERDYEQKFIEDFVLKGIENQGSQQCLFIAGMPGLGKTACIMKTMAKIKRNVQKDFDFYYINGFKLRTPNQFYTQFWLDMTGVKISQYQKVIKIMDHLFKENQISDKKYQKKEILQKLQRNVKVLVIDEIDLVKSKNQNILYNIFDWQHHQHSKLVIITLANTLNFPDTLSAKIQSRMGAVQLIFSPYTHEQIYNILTARLQNSKIFEESALKFLSMKVHSFVSDIRKALHLCRSAIHLFLQQNKINFNDNKQKKVNKITIQTIEKIVKENYEKQMCTQIQKSSRLVKIFLISLLYVFHNNNNKVIDLNVLFKQFKQQLETLDGKKLNDKYFKIIVDKLCTWKIIEKQCNKHQRQKIVLNCTSEEISYGLKDDELFQKHSHLGLFTLTQTANIKGELIMGQFQNEDNLKIYLDDQHETRIDIRNQFVFYDVKPGFYMMSISSQNYKFDKYKIIVDETQKVTVYQIDLLKKQQFIQQHPLVIQPIGVQKYFEIETGFNLASILKSPMGIMILVFGSLMLCMKNMPKLEELQEAERQRNSNQ